MGMNYDDFEVGRYYWKGTEEGVTWYTLSYVVSKNDLEIRFRDIVYGGKTKKRYENDFPADRENFWGYIYKNMRPANQTPIKVRHITIKSIFGKGVIK
jgi:hypothetical protein